ncbi:MAG: hypothetical protein NTZ61_02955, partial [Proteobacteria bacterium]|nr:hypothetical protein [Pseudomonadota bacterium]
MGRVLGLHAFIVHQLPQFPPQHPRPEPAPACGAAQLGERHAEHGERRGLRHQMVMRDGMVGQVRDDVLCVRDHQPEPAAECGRVERAEVAGQVERPQPRDRADRDLLRVRPCDPAARRIRGDEVVELQGHGADV